MSRRTGLRLGKGSVRFTFDGIPCEGIPGDTAASALLAAGVRLFGRSIKYHRPRGLSCAGPEEPNGLLTAACGTTPGEVPNLPAPCLLLQDGMRLTSQNRWPSLRYDLGALLGLGGGIFSAGFYYKTFLWPGWQTYEGVIRRLAGLGNAPREGELGPPEIEHIDCDVLVAGAGPAGLAAALAAARSGARTVLCEREPACGGELEFEDAVIDGLASPAWIAAAISELRSRGVHLLTDTAVVGTAGTLIIAHREPAGPMHNATVYRIRTRARVMATGAVEQPIVFVDNDRPGVMLLSAAERYLARYGVRVGDKAVLFGNHDRLYAAARRLLQGGIEIVAIVDTRADTDAAERVDLERRGVRCLSGSAVLATRGRRRLRGVQVGAISGSGPVREIGCDSLLVSGGWKADRDAVWSAAGSANDAMDLGGALRGGYEAGLAAAAKSRTDADSKRPPGTGGPAPFGAISGDPAPRCVPFWRSPSSPAGEKRQFVDLQNDVTVADLRQALEHGFTDIEHVKRFTTLGVGTEQGRTSGLPGAAILAELAGGDARPIEPSRRRPPYRPATLALLAGKRRGQSLRPERHTPLHAWHFGHGGVMEDAGGLWMRPRYYRANGVDAASASRVEASRVREEGGILDASTLGKIEVAGSDAAEFLDRLYLTQVSTIRVGRSKYMVLLREDGMVLDDGIVLRLADDRFLATVSSGHTEQVLSHLEFWRDTEWRARRVVLADVTEAWAVIAVAGRSCRDSLRKVLGAEWGDRVHGLTHLGFAEGRWHEQPLRVLRAGFSGELTFELHCRPNVAEPLWQALADTGLAPYGIEALDVLRVEKGYLTSAEFNGQTTPFDLGFESMVRPGNASVGQELLDRPGLHTDDRQRLVGLHALDSRQQVLAGAQVTRSDEPSRSCGHVTSAVYSPALGRWVALALVARRESTPDTELVARDPLRDLNTAVRVVSPIHFDPAGARMKS